MRKPVVIAFVVALLLLCSLAIDDSLAQSNIVLEANVEGAIDPAIAEYIQDALGEARRQQARALLVQLDTPGGLDESMRSIVKNIINSDIPVIVYVAPQGARAASAGTFITMAGHVAAMSPGTTIGAAHPVALLGDLPEAQEEKIVNDAVSYIKSIARRQGRNQQWAEQAVRRSQSSTADEAVRSNVVDFVAANTAELLERADGEEVRTSRGLTRLELQNVQVVEYPMSLRERILHVLANPNVAYFLLILGFYGIFFELLSPGIGFAGIGGLISLALGLYSIQVLPVNYVGVGLILVGLALLVAEALTPGLGVLGAGGAIAMLIGSFIFIDSPVEAFRVSPFVIIPTVATTFGLVIVALRAATRAHKRRPTTGIEGMLGLQGEVRKKLDPVGEVFVHGELWKAESIEGPIDVGEQVEVVRLSGLRLIVRRLKRQVADGGESR